MPPYILTFVALGLNSGTAAELLYLRAALPSSETVRYSLTHLSSRANEILHLSQSAVFFGGWRWRACAGRGISASGFSESISERRTFVSGGR
ncbi:hypothetical protein B0J12DRAFT_649285 [Macrophomina phaseolina]|uniref:Secreted protein n=1 Tax=Macrophomina phaseolina TaxID=35725 RepID=A0ABQ8GLM2_9PEZI|nr:hypothetical protein B0J12DRAFT_649285 [Macrophomina phaseolina]